MKAPDPLPRIRSGDGLRLLVGPAGSGKSALLEALLAELAATPELVRLARGQDAVAVVRGILRIGEDHPATLLEGPAGEVRERIGPLLGLGDLSRRSRALARIGPDGELTTLRLASLEARAAQEGVPPTTLARLEDLAGALAGRRARAQAEAEECTSRLAELSDRREANRRREDRLQGQERARAMEEELQERVRELDEKRDSLLAGILAAEQDVADGAARTREEPRLEVETELEVSRAEEQIAEAGALVRQAEVALRLLRIEAEEQAERVRTLAELAGVGSRSRDESAEQGRAGQLRDGVGRLREDLARLDGRAGELERQRVLLDRGQCPFVTMTCPGLPGVSVGGELDASLGRLRADRQGLERELGEYESWVKKSDYAERGYEAAEDAGRRARLLQEEVERGERRVRSLLDSAFPGRAAVPLVEACRRLGIASDEAERVSAGPPGDPGRAEAAWWAIDRLVRELVSRAGAAREGLRRQARERLEEERKRATRDERRRAGEEALDRLRAEVRSLDGRREQLRTRLHRLREDLAPGDAAGESPEPVRERWLVGREAALRAAAEAEGAAMLVEAELRVAREAAARRGRGNREAASVVRAAALVEAVRQAMEAVERTAVAEAAARIGARARTILEVLDPERAGSHGACLGDEFGLRAGTGSAARAAVGMAVRLALAADRLPGFPILLDDPGRWLSPASTARLPDAVKAAGIDHGWVVARLAPWPGKVHEPARREQFALPDGSETVVEGHRGG